MKKPIKKKKPAKAAPRQLFLISLQGQGDTQAALVAQDVFDWIQAPRPDFGDEAEVPDKNCPSSVQAKIAIHMAGDIAEGFSNPPDVTIGSCENDRALVGVNLPETVDGVKAGFTHTGDMVDFCREHNIAIAGEYEGYIY